MDGQDEQVNTLLELYLRHYMISNQQDWTMLLDVAQFSYNLKRCESLGASPFEIATRQKPLTSQTLPIEYKG